MSQSFRVFITFRSMRGLFFHFSKLFFIQNYRFLYHGDQKISWWTSCRWRAVNFEIHLWSSGVTAFGDRPASSMSKLAPAWTLTSEFDRINWPLTSEMFTFWICTRVFQWSCLKAVSVSTFVLGGLRGFTATSDLVLKDHKKGTQLSYMYYICKHTLHYTDFSFCFAHSMFGYWNALCWNSPTVKPYFEVVQASKTPPKASLVSCLANTLNLNTLLQHLHTTFQVPAFRSC